MTLTSVSASIRTPNHNASANNSFGKDGVEDTPGPVAVDLNRIMDSTKSKTNYKLSTSKNEQKHQGYRSPPTYFKVPREDQFSK